MLDIIKTRRSIRKFKPEKIEDSTIEKIIEMGTWAPSGLNNQPWRFVIVKGKETKDKLAQQTKYSHIIENAPVCGHRGLPAKYAFGHPCHGFGRCVAWGDSQEKERGGEAPRRP